MITLLDDRNIDAVMQIWLDSNISAHQFIPAVFWQENYDYVRKALLHAAVYVYEDEGAVKGFVGIVDERYIAGLFVKYGCRSGGIGKELLEHCKGMYNVLELDVYSKNKQAVSFYERNGFAKISVQMNKDTYEEEYRMLWRKSL